MAQDERFTRLWTQTQPVVAGYVGAMVTDFHQAEDLLQNVAVVLLRKFGDYDSSRPFVAWALGVAKREILASRRTRARSFLSYRPELVEAIAGAYEELAPELGARSAALRVCMDRVRDRDLELVRLRYEDSLPPRDIAARLGLAAGAVRVALSRVRAALFECMDRRLAAEGG